jgi:hypothetical protein
MLLVFGSAAALADLADDVRCREIGFSKSIEARDMDLFRSFLDEGPTLKWRPQIVEVLKDGKLALSRGPYKYTQKNEDGEDVDYWGTFNSIWRLQDDGSWKVVFDAGSPAAEPTDEQRALIDDDDDVALLGCGG